MFDRSVEAETGVADHDVEAAERRLGPSDETLHVSLVDDVDGDRVGASSGAADPFDGGGEPILAACPEHDCRSLPGQQFGAGESDP